MAVAKDIRALRPEGKPYEGEQMQGLFDGIAAEFDRLDVTIENVAWEVNPSTTTQLLERWEKVTGLPEEGLAIQDTIAGRRSDILLKLNATGGQSAAYIQSVLRSAGYDVDVTDSVSRPFTAGSHAGDYLTNGWQFSFLITVRGVNMHYFSVGSDAVGSPLASWDTSMMYRIVERIKPAHTAPVYVYE